MKGDWTLWTIGHSTRTLDEFLQLLQPHRIEVVADVRRHAGSRKYPHFGPAALAEGLAEGGVEYAPFSDLGGRRRPHADSRNDAWRNASFRGYADYMEQEAFHAAATRLAELAGTKRTAVMCAEAVWWRCHRALIADFFKVRGVRAVHILGPNQQQEHPFTSAAQVVDGSLSYAAQRGYTGPDQQEQRHGHALKG